MIWQNWGFSSMETVSADHSMVVRLDPVTYKFMEGRGDLVSGLTQKHEAYLFLGKVEIEKVN